MGGRPEEVSSDTSNILHKILTPLEERIFAWLCIFGLFGSILGYFAVDLYASPDVSPSQVEVVSAISQDKQVTVDIRTAAKEDLLLLPGIGEKRAQDILDRRAQKQFESLNELLEIKGIGAKTFAKLLPMLVPFGEAPRVETESIAPAQKTVQAPAATPKSQLTNMVNLNSASLDELCTLPGIGVVKAQAILDYRSENGVFQTIEDITKVKGIGAKTLEKIRSRLSI